MLRSLVTTGNETAIQDLTDQGALDSLCSILKNYSPATIQIEHIDVEILGDVFFTISAICEKDVHKKVKKITDIFYCSYFIILTCNS